MPKSDVVIFATTRESPKKTVRLGEIEDANHQAVGGTNIRVDLPTHREFQKLLGPDYFGRVFQLQVGDTIYEGCMFKHQNSNHMVLEYLTEGPVPDSYLVL